MLLQLSPILVFVGLIMSGRVTTLFAAATATIATLAVGWSSEPQAARFFELIRYLATGLWIAFPAVLVILAGLFFAECIGRTSTVAGVEQRDHRTLANICLIFGPFIETATGFGVGYAVVLTGLVRMGIKGGEALALAAFSQYLVPWGALGVGTRISTQISGFPIAAVGWRCAVMVALACCFMLPLFWRVARFAGVPPSPWDCLEWTLTLIGLLALLIAANLIFPIEVAGLAALGPVLVVRHLMTQGIKSITPALLRKIMPYVSLVFVLVITRLVPSLRGILEFRVIQPLPELARFAPLMSPALPLFVIGLIVASRRGGIGAIAWYGVSVLDKGWRIAMITFLLVGMASMMSRSGLSGALMGGASTFFGAASPALLPIAGAIGGYLTGSNAGAGTMSMPLLAGLAQAFTPVSMVWVVAATILTGSTMVATSPVRFAMGQALIGASTKHAQSGLKMLIPFTLSTLIVAIIVALSVTSGQVWLSLATCCVQIH
jgi:lactate permease